MKKKLLAFVVLALSIGCANVYASNDQDTKKCDNRECWKNESCGKACRKCLNPFEGITLTDAQKAKIDALKANCHKNMACKQKEACKKDGIDRRQCKKNYLSKVKEILTPEQYVAFLENMVVNMPARPKDGKRHHHGDKAPCGPRGECRK